MRSLVSIAITSWNSAATLERCLQAIFRQDYTPIEIIVVDNSSSDGTRAILKKYSGRCRGILNTNNRGFSAAQNQAIRESQGEWILSLNPDVVMSPSFVSALVHAGSTAPRIGTVCGKLLRWMPAAGEEFTNVLDSTGIIFLRNLRHLDRGSEETDIGQYDRTEFIFGATGAAAMYRRAMIDDISVYGEFFDEDFFAYREDADVAWRAQMMGWHCYYTSAARAWHIRRVTPERRSELPPEINWHSVKNRFLMRAKNISGELFYRSAGPTAWRDAMILGYAMLRDQRLLSAISYPLRKRESWTAKRKWIQTHRRVHDRELIGWFK